MNTFVLKVIALIFMTIDHMGAIFGLPFFFRVIGRVSFPIFAFCVGIGLIHTKDIKKYILRMSLFSIITIAPFSMYFHFANYYSSTIVLISNHLSVMFTFLASAICVFIYEKTFLGTNEKYAYGGGFVKKLLGSVLIFLTLLLCEPGMLLSGFLINTGLVESLDSIISTDYGFLGALLPFLIYLAKTKNKQMAIILLTTCLIYFPINTNSGSLSINPVDILLIAAANVSLFFIYFYNNKRGTGPKYLFYIYYPLHLLVFSLIYIFI